MSSFSTRDRDGGKFKQKFVRLRPIMFDGATPLSHREGGAYALPAKETAPGAFVSCWMLDSKAARDFIAEVEKAGNNYVLSLVVDTNVPGHPTVSMQLQEILVTDD